MKKINYLATLVMLTTVIYLQLGEKPDLQIYTIFGYNTGLNFSHPLLKIITFILIIKSSLMLGQDLEKRNETIKN